MFNRSTSNRLLYTLFITQSLFSAGNIATVTLMTIVAARLAGTEAVAGLPSSTTTLAQALAPRLRVNAVAPGPTLPSARQTDVQFSAQAENLPLQRGPRPDDIAAAVAYTTSDDAGFLTGQTICVDGGLTMC